MEIMQNKKVKIGIVGHGFVGKATDSGFDIDVEKFIVDPLLGTSIDDLRDFQPEIVFICVPTPMADDGEQDSSILVSVVKELVLKCPDTIKVIKSTVLPSILEDLSKLDDKVIYNPEFLREKHANEDFINSKLIIFGGEKKISKVVSRAYLNNSKCKTSKHRFTDISTASLIKYTINTFLASKVIYFNEIKRLFDSFKISDDWNEIIDIISLDERLGSSHMNVPGHDGKLGFGGACFPKDSLALLKLASKRQIELKILENVIRINNTIRKEYEELDARESEQNVSYDDKI